MSYTPTTWNTGDVVTAQKLNNIEQGIKGNETIFLDAVWAESISDGNLVNYNMSADDVIAAIEAGKNVKARLGYSSGGDFIYQWTADLVYYRGFSANSYIVCTFAVPHIVGTAIAPCAIHIVVDDGNNYQFESDFRFTYENVSAGLKWDKTSSSMYEYKVPMFYNDNFCGLAWDSVENIIDFGTTGEELIQAAVVGSETQKTTLSVVYDGVQEAEILHSVLTSAFSGACYIMDCGRGSFLKLGFSSSSRELYLRCVSSCNNGPDNDWATFEGYFPTAIAAVGGTISGVSLYKITLDLYAERTGDGDQTPYAYKAVATVSVEKIPSTIVPTS